MTPPRELPPPSFRVLVTQFVTQAMIELGEMPSPLTGRRESAPDRARFTIGMLEMLQDKTRGNLEAEEQGFLDRAVRELRARLDDGAGGAR